MEQVAQPTTAAQLAVINYDEMKAIVADIKSRSERGCLALSQLKAVTTDAEDEIANNLLVKARVTLEDPAKGIIILRKSQTSVLDAYKGMMMEPEKKLIAETERIKALRNQWANKKLEIQKQEDARIAREKAVADEISRVKAELRKAPVNGIVTGLHQMSEGIREHVKTMTLENWEAKIVRFNVKPVLREEKYNALFNVPYNKDLVSDAMYAAIVEEVKKEYPLEKLAEQYVTQAEGTIKMWRDDLPKKRDELEHLAQLEATNKIEAEKERERLRDEQDRQAAEAKQRLEDQQKQHAEEVQNAHDEERLQNEFEAQLKTQAGGTQLAKGSRKNRVAVISCQDADIVKTLSKVLYECFSNPKFPGILDKGGKVDENGVPVYAKWLQPLLTFVAKECDKDIEGITWKEVASTVASK